VESRTDRSTPNLRPPTPRISPPDHTGCGIRDTCQPGQRRAACTNRPNKFFRGPARNLTRDFLKTGKNSVILESGYHSRHRNSPQGMTTETLTPKTGLRADCDFVIPGERPTVLSSLALALPIEGFLSLWTGRHELPWLPVPRSPLRPGSNRWAAGRSSPNPNPSPNPSPQSTVHSPPYSPAPHNASGRERNCLWRRAGCFGVFPWPAPPLEAGTIPPSRPERRLTPKRDRV